MDASVDDKTQIIYLDELYAIFVNKQRGIFCSGRIDEEVAESELSLGQYFAIAPCVIEEYESGEQKKKRWIRVIGAVLESEIQARIPRGLLVELMFSGKPEVARFHAIRQEMELAKTCGEQSSKEYRPILKLRFHGSITTEYQETFCPVSISVAEAIDADMPLVLETRALAEKPCWPSVQDRFPTLTLINK